MTTPGERRTIFAYMPPGEVLSLDREPDGSVSLTVCDYDYQVTIPVPAWVIQGLVGTLALEPDLWPGCDCEVKAAQAEVGKPHGGSLS